MPATEPNRRKAGVRPRRHGRRRATVPQRHLRQFTQAPPPHTDTRPAFVSTREHRRFWSSPTPYAHTATSASATVRPHRQDSLRPATTPHRRLGTVVPARPKRWPAPSRPRGRPAESNGVLHPHRRRHHQADRPGLPRACQQVSWAIDYARTSRRPLRPSKSNTAEHRTAYHRRSRSLKTVGLEQVRDFYDRHHMASSSSACPALKNASRATPSSTAASASPTNTVLSAVTNSPPSSHKRLPHQTPVIQGSLTPPPSPRSCAPTNGNFRLADRLVTQIRRVLDINGHTHLTPEAVDAAQEALLIGH